jgi:hypothetical protein
VLLNAVFGGMRSPNNLNRRFFGRTSNVQVIPNVAKGFADAVSIEYRAADPGHKSGSNSGSSYFFASSLVF